MAAAKDSGILECEGTDVAPEIAPHKFLQYSDTQPLVSDASRLVAYILNCWTKSDFSVTRYRKNHNLSLILKTNTSEKTINLEFEKLVDHVREMRSFQSKEFGLPPLQSEWLDASFAISKPDAPITNAGTGEFLKLALATPFGKGFPLAPCIDREGAAYNSFQSAIQENIVTLHHRLVATSNEAPSLSNSWRNDLRMLLNECVSIVDISLHQLYFMAKYRPESGWQFNEDALGKRHGMRLKDKFRWIGKITGRHLDDAEKEISALICLKAVRNHFNHFDPPCVAYTVEDLAGWLNLVPSVGKLLWKIREKLRTQISAGIVEIIALPIVEFVPRNPQVPRVPQPSDVGYASAIWTESKDAEKAEPGI